MNNKLEHDIILLLIVLLIVIGLSGCGRNIQNCEFNPGVTVEQKKDSKKTESKIEENLNVKVSPKGEFNCSF